MVMLFKKAGRSFLKSKSEKAISPARAAKLPDVQQARSEKPRLKFAPTTQGQKPKRKQKLWPIGG